MGAPSRVPSFNKQALSDDHQSECLPPTSSVKVHLMPPARALSQTRFRRWLLRVSKRHSRTVFIPLAATPRTSPQARLMRSMMARTRLCRRRCKRSSLNQLREHCPTRFTTLARSEHLECQKIYDVESCGNARSMLGKIKTIPPRLQHSSIGHVNSPS